MEVIGEVNYRIQRLNSTRSKKKIVHYNRLKPWRDRPNLTVDVTSEEDTDEEENSNTDSDGEEANDFRDNEVLSSNSSSDSDDDRRILTRPSRYRGNRRLPRRYNDFVVQL